MVEYFPTSEQKNLKGYEIHMGATTGDVGLFKIRRGTSHRALPDGAAAGNVWGTYIHGIFDNDEFRRAFLNGIRRMNGLPLQEKTFHFHTMKQEAIDGWADVVRNRVDICFMLRQLGMESYQPQYCKVIRT
jgi:adenosylcobyric acid synthase